MIPCFIDTATEAQVFGFTWHLFSFLSINNRCIKAFIAYCAVLQIWAKELNDSHTGSKNIGRKSVSKDRANKIKEDFEGQGHKAKKWKRINQVEEKNNKGVFSEGRNTWEITSLNPNDIIKVGF